jgi:hypothetical protein
VCPAVWLPALNSAICVAKLSKSCGDKIDLICLYRVGASIEVSAKLFPLVLVKDFWWFPWVWCCCGFREGVLCSSID